MKNLLIVGMAETILEMCVGEIREAVIPPQLGFSPKVIFKHMLS